LLTEDHSSFNYSWGTTYDPNYVPDYGYDNVYNAFQYLSESSIKGWPYVGTYATYGGGGYGYKMVGSLDVVQGNLTLLKQMDWIDRRTRSVIIDFTVYNPNVGLFAVSQIVFEVLPTGNMIRSHRFEVLSLLTDLTDNPVFIGSGVVYMIFVLYLIYVELIKIWKKRLAYFRSLGCINNWLLIISSWVAFAIFMARLQEGQQIKTYFRESNGFGFLNLQRAA
jgi:hypothetical protein